MSQRALSSSHVSVAISALCVFTLIRKPPNWRGYWMRAPSPSATISDSEAASILLRTRGVGDGCVWLIERTGYEEGGIDVRRIERMGAAEVRWIHPGVDVVRIINSFPRGSIVEFSVFSHGLPGLVALRYGWAARGLPNYG